MVCHKYVHVPLLFSAGFLWLNIHNNFAHSFIFCFFFLSSFLCTKRWIVWISCFEVMYRQTINHILMFLCVVAGYKGKLNCSTFMQNTKLLILKDDSFSSSAIIIMCALDRIKIITVHTEIS